MSRSLFCFLHSFLTFASLLRRCWLLTHTSESLPSEPCSTLIYIRQKVTQSEQWNGCNRTKRREANTSLPLNTWESLAEKSISAFISGVWRRLPLSFYREYFAALMTFPSLPSFWDLPPPFPYTMGYVPCSPLPCTLILESFFIQEKQNKEIRSFFWECFFLWFRDLKKKKKKKFGRWHFPTES